MTLVPRNWPSRKRHGFVCSALSCPFSVQPRQVAPLSSAAAKKRHMSPRPCLSASPSRRRICTLPAHLKAGSLAFAWGRGRLLYQGPSPAAAFDWGPNSAHVSHDMVCAAHLSDHDEAGAFWLVPDREPRTRDQLAQDSYSRRVFPCSARLVSSGNQNELLFASFIL